jgi:hypothetical protein
MSATGIHPLDAPRIGRWSLHAGQSVLIAEGDLFFPTHEIRDPPRLDLSHVHTFQPRNCKSPIAIITAHSKKISLFKRVCLATLLILTGHGENHYSTGKACCHEIFACSPHKISGSQNALSIALSRCKLQCDACSRRSSVRVHPTDVLRITFCGSWAIAHGELPDGCKRQRVRLQKGSFISFHDETFCLDSGECGNVGQRRVSVLSFWAVRRLSTLAVT